jgi:hypothetical protein
MGLLSLYFYPTAKKCLDALYPTEHSIPGRPICSDRPRSRARAESRPDTEPPGPGPVHEARPDTEAPGPGPVRTTRRHLASVCVLLHPPGIVPHFASARSSYAISLDPPPFRSSGWQFPVSFAFPTN